MFFNFGIVISFIIKSNLLQIARIMTNTPSMVGEGATAYALGNNCTLLDGEVIETLFSGVGSECHPIRENMMDAVTGLSGSGPAYMYLVIGTIYLY